MKVIRDNLSIPTADIIIDLLTSWDAYQEHKFDENANESMPLMLDAAAARMYALVRTVRFATMGLIVTNLMWILNATGVLQW
jgi:hypothetical protein